MKFWDTSAIVPLLVAEPMTPVMRRLTREDPGMLVWWATRVECVSAITRLVRDGSLDEKTASQSTARLKQLADEWHEIEPSEAVRESAERFLRVHPLRTADALQLAAAFIAAERRPPSLAAITLDDRLALAMRKEGFELVEAPLN